MAKTIERTYSGFRKQVKKGNAPVGKAINLLQQQYIRATRQAIRDLQIRQAKRQALDDISVVFADSVRSRTTALAIYVKLPDSENEQSVAGMVREHLQKCLASQGFTVVVQKDLSEGSFGAIIFTESDTPQTRNILFEKLEQFSAWYAKEVVKLFQKQFVAGSLVVIIGLGGILFNDGKLNAIKCEEQNAISFHEQIIEAKNASDISTVVTKYCVPVNTTWEKVKAFK